MDQVKGTQDQFRPRKGGMKATLAGHPLHPQLIGFPLALFPLSLVYDLLHLFTKNKSYGDSAYRSMLSGFIGAGAAAGSGAIDYFAIPSGTRAKKVANAHLLLNMLIMNLYGLNLLLRRRSRSSRPGTAPMLLSLVGNVTLFASGWLGGHLVYHHGIRVRGVSPIEAAPDLKLPLDEALERLMGTIEEFAPGEVQATQEVQGTQMEERREAA